jgi:hypothetical protein
MNIDSTGRILWIRPGRRLETMHSRPLIVDSGVNKYTDKISIAFRTYHGRSVNLTIADWRALVPAVEEIITVMETARSRPKGQKCRPKNQP